MKRKSPDITREFLGEQNNPFSRCPYIYDNIPDVYRYLPSINLAYLINWYTRRAVNFYFIFMSQYTSNTHRSLPGNLINVGESEFNDNRKIPFSMLGANNYRVFTIYNDCMNHVYLMNLLRNVAITPYLVNSLYYQTINDQRRDTRGNFYCVPSHDYRIEDFTTQRGSVVKVISNPIPKEIQNEDILRNIFLIQNMVKDTGFYDFDVEKVLEFVPIDLRPVARGAIIKLNDIYIINDRIINIEPWREWMTAEDHRMEQEYINETIDDIKERLCNYPLGVVYRDIRRGGVIHGVIHGIIIGWQLDVTDVLFWRVKIPQIEEIQLIRSTADIGNEPSGIDIAFTENPHSANPMTMYGPYSIDPRHRCLEITEEITEESKDDGGSKESKSSL